MGQGRNLDRVFNSRSGCLHQMQLFLSEAKLSNLKLLKTWPQQILCFPLLVDIALKKQTFFGQKRTFC